MEISVKVCKEFKIPVHEEWCAHYAIHFKAIKATELEEFYSRVFDEIKSIDKKLDSLTDEELVIPDDKSAKKRDPLMALADRRYALVVIKNELYDEKIRRVRGRTHVSEKAIDHGASYSTAFLQMPKVGMGFRGYRGVTL